MKTSFITFLFSLVGITLSTANTPPVTISAADSLFFAKAQHFFSTTVNDQSLQLTNVNEDELRFLLDDFQQRGQMSRPTPVSLAYFINAHNAICVYIYGLYTGHLRPENRHELKYWSNKVMELRGLILQQADERYFAALSCPAKDCPRSFAFAFSPLDIEQQADALVRRLVNDTQYVDVDHHYRVVTVSKAFKWLRKQTGIDELQFINAFRDETIPDDYKVLYNAFDFNLRE